MFELNSRTVCASPAMPTGFIFSSAMFVYSFVHPKLPILPSLFEFGLKSPLGTFLSVFFPLLLSFFASGGVNKGLKNCKENFHISALMCKGKLNANLQREGGGDAEAMGRGSQ